MEIIVFGVIVLALIIKDGIRRDRENRAKNPGTDEWVKESLRPFAGIEKD
jgi:hypothetical protein